MAYNPQNPNGATTSANSSPVVIASDQASVPVTGAFFPATQAISATSLPLPTGASSEATLSALNTKVTAVNTGAVTISTALPTGTNVIGSISNTGFNVTNNGIVATSNSTTTNLGIGGIFTGTSEDVGEYSTIMVSLFSSHASANDGLQLQQSSDGTNWDFGDSYSIPATIGKVFSVGAQAKFFRIIYTNGATATTTLRIQTLLSKTAKKFSSVRPQDGRTNDNDFEEALSYDMTFNGTTWDRMRSSAKGVQAPSAISVQDLKDAGRSRVSITFMAVAPATADTLLNLVKVTNGTAAAGATSIGVTTGKTLRISSITFSIKANAAAAAFATLTFRQNPAGATVIGSTPEVRVDVGNTAAVIGASDKVEVVFPDGMEFSGTQTLGVSLAAQAITNIISISINGFEY